MGKDGEEMASAMGTMTNDASYHVVDGNANEWTLHGVGDDDISPSMDSFANSANSSTAFSSANFVSQNPQSGEMGTIRTAGPNSAYIESQANAMVPQPTPHQPRVFRIRRRITSPN